MTVTLSTRYAVVPCPPNLIPRSEPPKQQVLWVGCSDSGFEETTVLDLSPDETIVLRTIGNMALENDSACASMVQYAMEILQVNHIIICGHYGCGVVTAECPEHKQGAKGPWFSKLESLRADLQAELSTTESAQREARFVELNVVEQICEIRKYPQVSRAIRDRGLRIHGLVYNRANNCAQVLRDAGGR